jgi:EmrB/QacA subfamily drug resistance transporter
MPADQPQTNPWLILLVLTGGIFMLLLDTTIVNVAQQKIREGLGASLSEIQWVLDAYILTFAVLLITFGRLGDVFGRKKFFIIGMAIFTVASALSGASEMIADVTPLSGAQALIITRVLQGLGGAFMMPQTLSMITVAFPAERRGAAMGIWGGVTALGAVIGPIIGGLIVTDYAWEWIFLINVPIGIATIIAAIFLVPESTDPLATRKIDYPGIVLSAGAIFALVFAMIEGQSYGWTDPLILSCVIASVVLGAAFVWWEARASDPMLKLELFKIRNFWAANLITLIMAFGMFGIFFPLTIFLQGILGYSPIRAGLTMTPMAVTIMLVAPFAGRLSDRIGSRWLLVTGLSTATVGVAFLSTRMTLDATWQSILPALVITGAGMGMTFPPMTNAAMREVPPRISGSASGVINTVRNIGQVLGIAILGTLLQVWARDNAMEQLAPLPLDPGVQSQLADAAGEGRLDLVASIVPATDQAQQAAVFDVLRVAFNDAMQSTFYVSVGALLVGAVTALLVRNVVGARRSATQPVAEPMPASD